MRTGILASVLFLSTIAMMPSAVAQATQEAHERQPRPLGGPGERSGAAMPATK